MASVLQRLRQGLEALSPRLPGGLNELLTTRLTPAQIAAFQRLPIHDQAHLCRVCRTLLDRGVHDPDLLAAALLHDLGKVGTDGRVRLIDRVLRVVLARTCPALLLRLAADPAPRWRAGLARAVHHPQLGAARAAGLGCSARTCWLIAHHHDRPLPDDDALRLLVAADEAADHAPPVRRTLPAW